jgi:hypothetical protein
MNLLPLALVATALLAPRVLADKFWLGSPNDPKQAEGSVAEFISGVLIDETKTEYHIRIAGGEIMLPKNRVIRVEKDGLTVDAVVRSEHDRGERLAAEDLERRRQQAEAMDAVARDRAMRAAAVEASMRNAEGAAPVPAVQPGYDAVRHVALPSAAAQAQQMIDLKAAYAETQDHAYIKQLRQLRRMY